MSDEGSFERSKGERSNTDKEAGSGQKAFADRCCRADWRIWGLLPNAQRKGQSGQDPEGRRVSVYPRANERREHPLMEDDKVQLASKTRNTSIDCGQ
jgi:hypothetical protein